MDEKPIVEVSYTEPSVLPPTGSTQLEIAYGNLPNSRWKNVGRMVQLKIIDDATTLTTGDGKVIFMIPPELDGSRLIKAVAFVSTVSGGGTAINIQVRNITQTTDCLTTALTIDNSEYTSLTAATNVVMSSTIMFRGGDLIAIDVDQCGSGAKGLGVQLSFQ